MSRSSARLGMTRVALGEDDELERFHPFVYLRGSSFAGRFPFRTAPATEM